MRKILFFFKVSFILEKVVKPAEESEDTFLWQHALFWQKVVKVLFCTVICLGKVKFKL